MSPISCGWLIQPTSTFLWILLPGKCINWIIIWTYRSRRFVVWLVVETSTASQSCSRIKGDAGEKLFVDKVSSCVSHEKLRKQLLRWREIFTPSTLHRHFSLPSSMNMCIFLEQASRLVNRLINLSQAVLRPTETNQCIHAPSGDNAVLRWYRQIRQNYSFSITARRLFHLYTRLHPEQLIYLIKQCKWMWIICLLKSYYYMYLLSAPDSPKMQTKSSYNKHFYLTMDHMTTCIQKVSPAVTNPQRLMFWFYRKQLYCFWSQRSYQCCFQTQQAAVFS